MDDFYKQIKREITEDDVKKTYDNIKKNVEKFGHTTSGTVDGPGNLERPFAHTFGYSHTSGYEILSFFPIKNKGLSIIGTIFNRVIEQIQLGNLEINDQILNNKEVYYLPLAMHVLDKETQKDIESVWAKQLERDGVFAEFSTDDHRLILIIATDKDGNFPWDEGCQSFWPEMCPPPLAAMAQMAILGEDTLLSKLEVDYKINK
tara:strand:+ start:66 stop:677 length:612 start_codon:yes stop_codon:yes gene_type:complete